MPDNMTSKQRSPRRELDLASKALENARHAKTAAESNFRSARRRYHEALGTYSQYLSDRQKGKVS